MEQIINENQPIVFYIHVDGKKYGPYPQGVAEMQLANNKLQLSESQLATAQIVPSTQDGKQILLET